MRRKITMLTLATVLAFSMAGCGKKDDKKEDTKETTTEVASETDSATTSDTTASDSDVSEEADKSTEADGDASATDLSLVDGIYYADFNTDSSMFHVNEAKDGKGILRIENGAMSIEIALVSKNITNLYLGLAADAEGDEANWINPGTEVINYNDGTSEEVNSFVVPVSKLNSEFDLAILGKKGKWYDHKVSVSNPYPMSWNEDASSSDANDVEVDADNTEASGDTVDMSALADGEYEMEVTLTGGSGKTTVESPTAIKVESGNVFATIIFSSPHYDYMLVDGERYEPVNTDGNSTFIIPVSGFDIEMPVIGDTTAMSKPHEIEYTLNFKSSTIKNK